MKMKKIDKYILPICYTIVFIIVITMFNALEFNSNATYIGFNVLTNSDSCLLVQISKDILSDPKAIFDWHYGTCFYFFPNLLIVLLLTTFLSTPSIIIFVNSLLIFFITLFLLNYLFLRILHISKICVAIANLSLTLFLAFTADSSDFCFLTPHLFMPLHSGALINALGSLILCFMYLNNNNKTSLVFLIILSIVAMFSDFIFLIYFSIPLVLTLLTLYFFGKKQINRKKYITVVLLLVFSYIFTFILHKISINSGIFMLEAFKNLFYNIKDSFILMFNSIFEVFTKNYISIIIFFLSSFSLVLSFFHALKYLFFNKNKKNIISENSLLYSIFTCYFLVLIFAATIINGSFQGIDCIRYIIPPFYIGIFNIGLYIHLYAHKRNKVGLTRIIALSFISVYTFFIILNYSLINPSSLYLKVKNYYPPMIKAADNMSLKYKVKNGIGNYWDARFITIFSKQGITVDLVSPEYTPMKFANNPRKYYTNYNNDSVYYNFIVNYSNEDTAKLYQVFNKKNITKDTIEGNIFYLLPSFYLENDFRTFRIKEINN